MFTVHTSIAFRKMYLTIIILTPSCSLRFVITIGRVHSNRTFKERASVIYIL